MVRLLETIRQLMPQFKVVLRMTIDNSTPVGV